MFYMIVFMILMTFTSLTKNTFKQGYLNYADDTKIELLFGIKAFVVSFVFLCTWGSTTFFDFNPEKAHEESLQRINLTLSLINGNFNLPKEFTYAIISVFAGLTTFATTKLNIRFAYYFYVLTKNS